MVDSVAQTPILKCKELQGQFDPPRKEVHEMAKTIKIKTTLYDVTADVVVKDDNGISLCKFDGEGSSTKSVRALTKTIREDYESAGLTVLAIDGLTTTKRVVTTTYVINASNDAILAACIAADLNINISTDNGAQTEESEEDTED